MNRISVETMGETLSDFQNAFGDSSVNKRNLVEITIPKYIIAKRFHRLYPYENENIHAGFDLAAYEEATNLLSDFFHNCIGNPDQSYQGNVVLAIIDYRGKNKRMARHYVGDKGIDVYVMTPTRIEMQSTVIPAPDDISVFREHPVATIDAIRYPYILSGRLYNGNVYPPVNDFGAILPLNELNASGGYQHWGLTKLPVFLDNQMGYKVVKIKF